MKEGVRGNHTGLSADDARVDGWSAQANTCFLEKSFVINATLRTRLFGRTV